MRGALRLALPATVIGWALAGCEPQASREAGSPDRPAEPGPSPVPEYVTATDPDATETAGFTYAGPVLVDLPPLESDAADRHETERDWAIALGTVEWARTRGLERLPIGEVMAMLGATFVGSPYVPGSLELPGPESLVVNLHTFDCVTLVEHVLVLARLTLVAPAQAIADTERFRELYRAELTRVRYRDGILSGYPSRLHYFSEWIRNAEAKGLAEDLTRSLGGAPDTRSVHYMSAHPDTYRQLGEDPAHLAAIQVAEARLRGEPRYAVPADRIAEVEDEIRTGDIIAAVSTVDGLDIAHTGIAILHQGRIHLLHAPLVGDSVEISVQPLVDRIQGIATQSGIMVARPLPPAN